MGSVDKLIKALENLKIFQTDASEEASGTAQKKKNEPLSTKDKIINCNIIADCLCSPSVRAAPEFPNFVGIVIETLLSYANDKESDVRMVSDECLNRITRVLLDTNLGRLQVEFYKELKKNGPSRCVRSALWRFAELAPLIRPHKRRAFVNNLLSCVTKMAERHEEALQESLMSAMTNICSTLMSFATDGEIKGYLAPFINNLCSTSAVVRRVASTCASTIVLHSMKPVQYINFLLKQVLDKVLPIMHSTSTENLPIMLGCLHCIRLIIPLLDNEKVLVAASMTGTDIQDTIKLDTTITLFELVVHCLQKPYPSVTTAALECYQQLLKTPTLPGFLDLMLIPGSISSSVLAAKYEASLAAKDASTSPSKADLAISDTDSNSSLDELHVNLSIQSDFLPADPQAASAGEGEEGAGNADSPSSTGRVELTLATSDSCSSLDGVKIAEENIGCLTDPAHPPILYSARLLCQSFLLTGNIEERLYADREVRVSIKSLALSCMSNIMRIYPQCIDAQLYVSEQNEGNQPISDILLYHKHLDPQLQGMIAQVLGNLIHAGVNSQLAMPDCTHQDIESHIEVLTELLDNDNSMAIRLTLTAVKSCINSLLNSCHHDRGVQILDRSFIHSSNNYWLVRVDLLELVSELDMLPLILLSGIKIQTAVMEEVVIRLLGDSDYRVRQAAGSTLVRLVPQLFYGSDHPHQSVLLARADSQLNSLLYPFLSDFPIDCPPLLHGLPFPYHDASTKSKPEARSASIQSALSKVICRLLETFSSSSSLPTKLGIVHALYELSEAYPVTKYAYAWSCATGSSCAQFSMPMAHDKSHSTTSSLHSMRVMDELRLGSGGGSLTLIMSLLTHSSLSLDLGVHQDLLALAGNLLSGACLAALKQGQANAVADGQEKLWPGIYDRLLVSSAEKLLSHLIRLLNIYAHVLEDTSLIASSNPKAVLDAAREAITNPLKKKASGKPESQANESVSEPQPKTVKEAEKAVKSKKETLGTFNHIPFYVKLHEAVRGAHLNYKVSLSLSKMDKFTNMLHQTLTVFSQLLEIASLQEIGKCTEEILEYLKSIVVASPVATVSLVHQLLKALFGTNLSSQYEELIEKKVISRSREPMVAGGAVVKPGLFTCCLSSPYADLAQSLAHNPFRGESDDYHCPIYVLKRCEERKMPVVLKTGANVDKNTVGAYIRLFEPLVIKSLKMYTLSSSVHLQTEVLNLLVQLIQLRVNYCLLDNDEVFLGYVLRQVDMISEGPPSEQAGLIRCIFRLLLLLSYEKLHSKTLVVVPRIMQLCDGVMAGGQNPITHAIPALEMLVKDLFLCRSTNTTGNADTAFHDIETQREVTASMLLRLIQHTEVLGLLTIVLYQLMRESEEKWKKLSRQVIDRLLPLATTQQIAVETRDGMHALHNILLAVSPSVYRPVDMLLKALFTQQNNMDSRVNQQRWMSIVLAILRVLLSMGKEEVILSRLNELEIAFDTSLMSNSFAMSNSGTGHMFTSQESTISSSYGSVPPQELLASFLTQVIGFCTEVIHIDMSCCYVPESSYSFSLQQFSLLLLYTSYMLQSGHFRKVAKFMMEQLCTDTSHLHHLVMKINMYLEGVGARYPTIALQWSYILMLLNYNDQTWWRRTLKTASDSNEDYSRLRSSALPINQQIVKCAGLAMYCDYVVENIHDAEHLTWLTVNHINDIIDQLHEAPVHDFMSAVYGNSSASGLFISAVQSRYNMAVSPSKLYNLVTCLRSMHKDQSGLVVVLLAEKMLSVGHSGITRLADSVACRRVEVLLAEHDETVHKQLSEEDITKVLSILQTNRRKHRRLLALVEKLRARFYPTVIPPPAFSDNMLASVPAQVADKDFYLYITKLVCSNIQSSPRLCASLLGSLEVPDILSVISDTSFQTRCLAECIKHGANKTVRTDTGTVISDGAAASQDSSPLFAASEGLLKDLWKKILPSIDPNVNSGSLDESTTFLYKTAVSVDVVLAICAYLDSCTKSSLDSLDQSELQAICGIAYSYFDKIKVSGIDSMMQSSHMMFSWTSHVEDVKPEGTPGDMCQLYAQLSLLSQILKHNTLSTVFSANVAHVFTVIDSVTYILKTLGVTGLTPELEEYKETLVISQDGYIQVSQLVTCLSDVLLAGKSGLPRSLVQLLNSVIIGLARLQCVNEHARMPVSAFVISSEPREDNQKPQLKVDALQDTTVLREFIKRNNLLGWINRPQFEETWACLLHLLSPVAVVGSEEVAVEEDVENIEWMVSSLRGITGLLCQTLNKEEPGNPLYTCYTHIPRQKPVQALDSTVIGQKLQQIRLYLERKCGSSCQCMSQTQLFCSNIERINCSIGYNQLSVDYLNKQMNMLMLPSLLMSDVEKADLEKTEKSASGQMLVDTASCLKLLIDVYTHLMSPTAKPKTPLMLLNECVKSTVMLSDLFYEKGQYDWMYNSLWTLLNHHIGEDELMNQYMLLGLCKAAAMHSTDSGGEKLYKLIETSLKSTHIPTRLAAIYGSLYLLESESDQLKSLLHVLIEYVSRTMTLLTQKSLILSELYSLSVWSLAFYIIENNQELLKSNPVFTSKVIQCGIQFVTNCESNCTQTVCSVILNGFERLLLTNSLTKQEGNILLKLSSDRLSLPAMHVHLQSVLGLLVTCMYTDQSDAENDEAHLTMTELKMELISILFDRIRRGLPQEAEIITGVLPTLMSDLFSSQDIMNKVIGEFLSEQQPHLTLIARMVYEVFEQQATATGGPALLHDWVLLSITSFTQRNPLAAAVWSLTCFFVSASSNHWLRGLFPFISSRIGLLEPVDEMIFLLSCKDFYSSIANDSQKKQTLISMFQSAARNEQIYKTALDSMN